MSAIDRFLEDVAHAIAPGLPGASRFGADLRTHHAERLAAGEAEPPALARMGDPAEVAGGFLEAVDPPLASRSERLGGFLFDLGLGLAAVAGVAALGALTVWRGSPAGPATPGIPGPVRVALVAVAILMFLAAILYFPVFEALFGQTAGKRVFGIAVAKENGARAGWGAAILRRIPFAFDMWPFDAAFLLFTARRQRAFDLVAKTIVFRTEGRHPARPWLGVAAVWLAAVTLGALAALAGGAFG